MSATELVKSYTVLSEKSPETPRLVVETVGERLRAAGDDVSLHWGEVIDLALSAEPAGLSLRQFMLSHHDEPMDTMRALVEVRKVEDELEVDLREISGMSRRVDAERRTHSVFLGESRFWYSGITRVTSTPHFFIGVAPYGDDLLSVWVFAR